MWKKEAEKSVSEGFGVRITEFWPLLALKREEKASGGEGLCKQSNEGSASGLDKCQEPSERKAALQTP